MVSVLIVDDESHIRQELALFPWDAYGACLVGEASNGRQALQLCRAIKPDVLVTDIEMPVMDGIELARALREEASPIQIIFLTCHDQFSYAQKGIELGIAGYLLKLFLDEEKLGGLLERARHNIARERSVQYQADEVEREALEYALQHGMESPEGPDLSMLLRHIRFPSAVCALYYYGQISWAEVKRQVDKAVGGHPGYRLYRHMKNGFILHFPPETDETLLSLQSQLFSRLNGVGGQACRFCTSKAIVASDASIYSRFALNSAKMECIFFYHNAPLLLCDLSSPEACQEEVLELVGDYLVAMRNTGRVDSAGLEEVRGACSNAWLDPNVLKLFISGWIQQQLQEGDNIVFVNKIFSADAFDEVIVLFHDCLEACNNRSSKRYEVLQTLYYIERHYTEPVKLSDIAERLHLSTNHLGRIFKKDTGKGFNEVLNETRIHSAIELLKTTNMKVYEIADAVGIGSYRYFWNLFREITGRHPSDYRPAHHKEAPHD
ncbi:response regulator [Ruminococcaceae bacterium OttesenSCG-928-L11]|nr:response regulator [Ruminococcaceae bacterium OttesenSCG-928-L11]